MTATPTDDPPVRLAVDDDGVATITLCRPEKRNAQDTAFIYAFSELMDLAARSSAVKVIRLRAEGPHFSAGHDLSEADPYGSMKGHIQGTWADNCGAGVEPQMARERELYLDLCERWRNIPKPTIAQVHGACIAGGLMLAWPCDIIVASDDAVFQDNTIDMGVGGVEYFVHLWELGHRKSREYLFTGDTFGAAEAHRLGMVNHVVPRAELDGFGLDLARRIAAKPLFALKLAKEAINAAQDAQGRQQALRTAFALHQLAHGHNLAVHGLLIDPGRLKPGIVDKSRAAISGKPDTGR